MIYKPMMRRAEVVRLIESRGYHRADFETLIEANLIARKEVIPGKSRAYYYREQIEAYFPMNHSNQTTP